MKPCLSVITPVYNSADYLPACIESILAQTLTDFEYIIVDDGSTDASCAIAQEYAARDARLRVIRQENSGPSQARNAGLELARASFVAFQDADDIAAVNRLEEQYAFLEGHPECGAVGCFLAPFDDQGGVYRELRFPTDPAALRAESLAGNCVIGGCAMMVRVASLPSGGFPRLSLAEDYALLLAILKNYELGIVPRVLLHYRQHGNSASSTKALTQCYAAQIVRYHFLFSPDPEYGFPSPEGLCTAAVGHESEFWTELTREVLASRRIPAADKVQHLELALQSLPPHRFQRTYRRKLLSAILRLPVPWRTRLMLIVQVWNS